MLAVYLQAIDTEEDRNKFEECYKKYKETLYHVAYEILQDPQYAEDAVHDAFLILAQHMNRIENKTRIQIRNYLLIIVRNASFRIHQKNSQEICSDDLLFSRVADPLMIEREAEEHDSRTRLNSKSSEFRPNLYNSAANTFFILTPPVCP